MYEIFNRTNLCDQLTGAPSMFGMFSFLFLSANSASRCWKILQIDGKYVQKINAPICSEITRPVLILNVADFNTSRPNL